MRSVIAILKLIAFVLSSLFTIAYQSTVFLFTKGEFAYIYPQKFHAFLCRILGLKIIVEGRIETGRNLVYIGNHISYLDIEAVGSLVKGAFVAKKDVETWPFFGILGKMGRTLYISRAPADAARETKMMTDRLEEGFPLIVFAEGTSSNGTKILPFKSSFFEIFLNKNIRIQPFTISILSVDEEKAATDNIRDKYAWHGDMTLEPHLWSFLKSKGAVIKIKFEKPVLSSEYTNRKDLSSDLHSLVAKNLDLSVPEQ